jgi:adenosylcobinamide kinase/adenosylcobinamide-phosphate guanylyltransferase
MKGKGKPRSYKRELIFILGGARSGKSVFAEKLARERGGDAVLFIATAEAGDEEMKARIAEHRARRPSTWETIEAPREASRALENYRGGARVIVLDCLTLLVSNVLLADKARAREWVERQVDALIAWQKSRKVDLIVVSNEVGMGIVPDNALGRAYRDLLGAVNQRLAREADRVFMMVAGLPLEIK